MIRTDMPVLAERLTELADAIGGKRPTAEGLKVWASTLAEFPLHQVVDVLTGWAKRATKMPAPADVWKVCNDQRTERIEQEAKVNNAMERKESAAAFQRSDRLGKALRALSREVSARVSDDPKEWAHVLCTATSPTVPNPPRGFPGSTVNPSAPHLELVQEDPNGTPMTRHQIEAACSALHRTVQQADEARSQLPRIAG